MSARTSTQEPVDSSARRLARPGRDSPRRRRLEEWLFLVPALVFLVLLFGYPVVYNVALSVRDYTVRSFYTGDADLIGLANYVSVVNDPIFPQALTNTVLFTVGSIVGQFVIGLGLALFFRRNFPLNRLLRALLLLPWLLPLLVSGTVFRWILDQDYGILNQVLLGLNVISEPVPWLASTQFALLSVILANIWVGIPFNMVLLYSGLQAIPAELYEAAAIDGATAWQRFWYVTLPMLRPVTAIVLMLGLIYTLKVFDLIMVLTGGGPANATQTMATWAYDVSFQDLTFGRGGAVGNLLVVIAFVFALIYLRSTRSSSSREVG